MKILSIAMTVAIIPSERFFLTKFDRCAPDDHDYDFSIARQIHIEKKTSSHKVCQSKNDNPIAPIFVWRTSRVARYRLLHIPDFAR